MKSKNGIAVSLLEERIEELKFENQNLREEKEYFQNIVKQFSNTISDVEFDEEDEFDDSEEYDEEDEFEDEEDED